MKELNLEKCQALLREKRVLVVGDVMLDRYLFGKVERISPEAPVPVLDVHGEDQRPGGAANVAVNLVSLGVSTTICGVIGPDAGGEQLRQKAKACGLDVAGLIVDETRQTTTKTRLIGNAQQMMRIDRETTERVNHEIEDALLHRLKELQPWDALVIEDYDKGLLGETLIQQLIQLALRTETPVLVDPKFRNFFSYTGCTWFKPNLKELLTALKISLSDAGLPEIAAAAIHLRELMPHDYSLVTLSERGVLVVEPGGAWRHVPAHVREIRDVSGAGDTVIAALTVGLLLGFDAGAAAAFANLAGGLACEELGVVPVGLNVLLEEYYALEKRLHQRSAN